MARRLKRSRVEVVFMQPLLAFFFLGGPFSSQTAAAVQVAFFDSAIVNDTAIRLGDIASISGNPDSNSTMDAATILIGEAAPAGYSRYVNIDDVARHILSARKISCENSLSKRIRVKTDFQECCIANYENDITACISKRIEWKAGDYQLKIINKNEKWKCLKQPFSVTIEGIPSNYPRGNFNCKLIARQGSRQMKISISCFLSVCTPVVVSSMKIQRGTNLTAENCHIEKIDITHFRYMPYVKIENIENKLISRTINPGTILHEKLCIVIPVVECNEQVQLTITKGRIKACIFARARESGIIGEKILVENEMTHKLMKATIIKKGQVVLLEGDGKI